MNINEKVELITQNAEEVILKEEIQELFSKKKKPRAYIGFEVSGKVHIGNGLMCSMKMHDLIEAGVDLTIFLADWHSWINNKLDGDLDKIRVAGEYFIECFKALGLTEEKVTFLWTSDLVKDPDYWATVIRVAKSTSLNRVLRALPIMGREMDKTDIESAWIYYPAMQAADIFFMNIDIAYGGMDQRKAHMIAREAAPSINKEKPIALHTPLLTGLTGAGSKMDAEGEEADLVKLEAKMSKSKPETCIFIHDTKEEIKQKLKTAYCPTTEVEGNPVLEICKYIIFARKDSSLTIHRPEKYGGDVKYTDYAKLEEDFLGGGVHPLDLKNNVAEKLSKILQPVHEYFDKHPEKLEAMEKVLTETKKNR
ncbi:MAG: tyrosine--tRNA ligase [Candidatus Heimdallarchaeota archaeon]|nr:tyrosine--tRNA ligase [Candidatus Heimdallarchaeota archaeon]